LETDPTHGKLDGLIFPHLIYIYIYTVFSRVISAAAYFAHPNF